MQCTVLNLRSFANHLSSSKHALCTVLQQAVSDHEARALLHQGAALTLALCWCAASYLSSKSHLAAPSFCWCGVKQQVADFGRHASAVSKALAVFVGAAIIATGQKQPDALHNEAQRRLCLLLLQQTFTNVYKPASGLGYQTCFSRCTPCATTHCKCV